MNATPRLTFVDAVASGFRNWRNTKGVASRREFWFWLLFTALVSVVIATIDSILFPVSEFEIPDAGLSSAYLREVVDTAIRETLWSLSSLVSVLLFIPTLTVTVRRFRDAGAQPALAWGIQLFNPVSTVVLVFLIYAMVNIFDTTPTSVEPTSADMGLLGILVLSVLTIAAANLVAFVMMIVVASRPTRAGGTL